MTDHIDVLMHIQNELDAMRHNVRQLVAEIARLRAIEAAALAYRRAVRACDGIQAAEAALFAELGEEGE